MDGNAPDNRIIPSETKSIIEYDAIHDDHSSHGSQTDVDGLHESELETRHSHQPPLTGENAPDPEKLHPKQSNNSEKPYSAFSQKEKILIILCATLGGLFSPFTTNIYFPALDTIASSLGVSISKVNLTITTYMIFQAISPTFISTLTDTQGRRPTYIVGFIIYIIANIGLALNNSYAGLLVLRCLQSAGSSGMVTLQQAIIADVVTSAERGSYIGITSITGIVAPSVAPIIGGVLSQHLGWHSVFWFLLIMSGVYLIPMLLFMPETSRKIVDDGSKLPPRWNMSLLNVFMSQRRRNRTNAEAQSSEERVERMKLKWPNPMSTLSVFADKESAILLAYGSVCYAVFYGITSSLTVQFGQIYHLDSTYQGLLFLPQAIGSIMSAFTNGILMDRNYRRHCRKLGVDVNRKKQVNMVGFPIERIRIELALPLFAVNSLFIITYGWLLDYEVHIAGPIVMLVFIGYTMLAGFNGLTVLFIDINRHRAAAASAASNLSRCLLGAGMTAVINPMILAMGRGWTFTFAALVQICFLPLLWLCMKRGMQWRAAKDERRQTS